LKQITLKESIIPSRVETHPFSMKYVPVSELAKLKNVCIVQQNKSMYSK
jgi:hypothetical protein